MFTTRAARRRWLGLIALAGAYFVLWQYDRALRRAEARWWSQ